MLRNILTILMLVMAGTAMALTPGDIPPDSIGKGGSIWIQPGNPGIPSRPKAPSRQIIRCEVNEGLMTIAFSVPEGMCLLKLTDTATGKSLEEVFDTSGEHSFYVGPLIEGYIKLSTSKGNIYGATFW